jgi:hypothetical protein
MNNNQKQYSGLLEINDLIDDAVSNAIARRSELVGLEDTLSDEESASIAGGIAEIPVIGVLDLPIIITTTTVGIIDRPPIRL